MTQLNTKIITRSFDSLKKIGPVMVDKFLEIGLKENPTTQLFYSKVNTPEWKKDFYGTCVFVVENINNSTVLTDFLSKVGARHLTYDLNLAQFESMRVSLLNTLSYYFKEEWTHDLKIQWELALSLIFKTMIDGATLATKVSAA